MNIIQNKNPVKIIQDMLRKLSPEDLKALGAIEVDFYQLVGAEILKRPKFNASAYVNYAKTVNNGK